MCTFCHNKEETTEHILWECDCVQSFLIGFEDHLNKKSNCQLVLLKKSFLLALYDRNKYIQNVLFIPYIYISRCTEKTLSFILQCLFKTFYTPVKNGTYYGMVMSVRFSVRPSVRPSHS
jgi:hypothetical protein